MAKRASAILQTHSSKLCVRCYVCDGSALHPGANRLGADKARPVRCFWGCKELQTVFHAHGHMVLDAAEVLSAASGLEWEQRASESGDVGVLSLQDAKLGGVPSAAAQMQPRVRCGFAT